MSRSPPTTPSSAAQDYDPEDWGIVGPDLVSKATQLWAALNPALVRYLPRVKAHALTEKV